MALSARVRPGIASALQAPAFSRPSEYLPRREESDQAADVMTQRPEVDREYLHALAQTAAAL
jgi:hypothetical protein